MADIDVTVAGRRRRLACEDGEERHLERLAGMLDEEARRLAPRIGPVGDAQILLMAGLMLADRLHDATETLRQAEQALVATQSAASTPPPNAAPGVTPPAATSPGEAPAQPGLFAEEEAARTLQSAIASLEAALSLREGDAAKA